MRIIIIGAGEVGFNIASRLASENKEVTVIDHDESAVRKLSDTLDIQTIAASGSDPDVLKDAGICRADLLLAVTDSDEINLVACLMAGLIAPDIKKMARLRNAAFDPFHDRFKTGVPGIDAVINPETEVVKSIRRLMSVPGVVDVGQFIDGQVKYAGIRIDPESPLTGIKLMDFPSRFKEDRPLIAAIIRNGQVIVPGGADEILPGDHVYFVCETDKLEKTLAVFGITTNPVKNVAIIGGGRVGERLARTLETEGVSTKIIESGIERCHHLSATLEKTIVLHGDGSDQALFKEENIKASDAVIAVTNEDETNILVSLLARNIGVKNTIARIEKSGYLQLLPAIGIEKVVSPRLSAISSILREVRKGKVLSDISIFFEKGEFIEAVAIESSQITSKPLKKLAFPKGSLLVCIVKENRVVIPTGDSQVEPGERMIIFAVKSAIRKLEKLLTVKLGFF